jgi:hypothetical protein
VELLEQQKQQMQAVVAEEWELHSAGSCASFGAQPDDAQLSFSMEEPVAKMMSATSGRVGGRMQARK